MNEIKEYTEKVFEDIKHIDEFNNEYWFARELMKVLEYSLWQNFHKTIKIAIGRKLTKIAIHSELSGSG